MGRLFDGWQVGLIVVVTALLAALLAVPRPELPDEIPVPQVDRRALTALSERDRAWAREADAQRLSFDLRALGESIRTYGRADADGDREAATRSLGEVGQRLVAAQQQGAEGLMRLRAAQMRIFLDGLAHFEATGEETQDLREVGGSIVATLQRSGWVISEGNARRIVVPPLEREVLFRRRWNEITGQKAPPLQATLAEEQAFYAFLLTHPVVSVPPALQASPVARCRSANEFLLRKVDELGRVDQSYPAKFARGVLLLRLARPRDAVTPLADFVQEHEDGPYVLRARNALRDAQERVLESMQ